MYEVHAPLNSSSRGSTPSEQGIPIRGTLGLARLGICFPVNLYVSLAGPTREHGPSLSRHKSVAFPVFACNLYLDHFPYKILQPCTLNDLNSTYIVRQYPILALSLYC